MEGQHPANGRALHTQWIPVRLRVIRADNKGKQSRRQMDALMPSIGDFGGKRCNSSDILPPKAHALENPTFDGRWSVVFCSHILGIRVTKPVSKV